MSTSCKLFFLLFAIVQGCSDKQQKVTLREDFSAYIKPSVMTGAGTSEEEIKFWLERISKNHDDETALVKLAGLRAEKFKTTGDIRDLLVSDSLYQVVLSSYPAGNVDIYHCLAANAITQHQFITADRYVQKALDLKDKLAASLLIQVDVSLELGDLAQANLILKDFRNKNSFAYLIRAAKVRDHEGHLDSAIMLMEKAYKRIKNNKAAAQWTLSNLGDMYGHAGRIEEAYQSYVTVLKNDPRDSYALKGIAWIAFSNDHNTRDAKEIIIALSSRKRMPEAELMLAEISAWEGDTALELQHLKNFKIMASAPGYKTMYHKYLANIEANELGNPEACIEIAKQEISSRPTPQSYDLLAWGYYTQKNFRLALEIAKEHVENQTSEPDALWHLGMIYHASGENELARRYLEQSRESAFELGPVAAKSIDQMLGSM